MKGKNQGKSVNTSSSTHSSSSTKIDDCPLKFPELQSVDHTRLCPRYTAVIERKDGTDSVYVEEADGLQTDLETLLASVGKRMRVLETEIHVLSNWQDKKPGEKHDKKSIGKVVHEPIPQKRGKGAQQEDKPNKKMKLESTPSGSRGKSHETTKSKGKNATIIKQELPAVESPAPDSAVAAPLRFNKNDAPNRFWQFIEPYCANITNDDLKVLEDILKSREDDSEFYKIPPLGKHYSQKWAQEDLMEEQCEGSKITERKRSSAGTANGHDASTLLRRYDASEPLEDNSPFGPLTQRLVSALIEENIMTPVDDASMTEVTGKDPQEFNASMSPRTLAKQLNIGNTFTLERRIKKELEEQGILECEDKNEDNPDDEVLMELKRKMAELKSLSAHNVVMTKRLHKLAKEEMARQEMKKKMAAADAEVMDAFRRIGASKSKKKTPTKKEKESAMKALKERTTIVKQLELM
ncbi:transcriptional adapter 3-B-like [Lineus longissimus]|uniref:transcriptional adapter 3-B-like n=1 Tax=Lineus longissimus TaxID=88925 RepID=UPI002B4C2BE8